MNLSFQTVVLLPVGLGLLGFVEPCSIGGHMLFLHTQEARPRPARLGAVMVFVAVRALAMGLFGAVLGWVGALLIGVQTWFWLLFGALYLGLGLAFLSGRARAVKHRLRLAPEAWRRAQNPALLGLAFGLNIPACAAPILFGLLGLSAGVGSSSAGFAMMALFGFALSFPLVPVALFAGPGARLSRLASWLGARRWVLGGVFVLLGLWSIWFGLYVDPADWAGA